MIDNIPFLLVFLAQIYVGSYYIPKKILHRMQRVYTMYPPSEYPKLYPYSLPHYFKNKKRYKNSSKPVVHLRNSHF